MNDKGKKIFLFAIAALTVYVVYNYVNNRKSDDTLNNTDLPQTTKN